MANYSTDDFPDEEGTETKAMELGDGSRADCNLAVAIPSG